MSSFSRKKRGGAAAPVWFGRTRGGPVFPPSGMAIGALAERDRHGALDSFLIGSWAMYDRAGADDGIVRIGFRLCSCPWLSFLERARRAHQGRIGTA